MRPPLPLSSHPATRLLEFIEGAVMGDQQNFVESERWHPTQPPARFVARTNERYICGSGEFRGFGPGGEIDADIGEDRVGAAGFAIDAHTGLEILPAAVPARRGPARAFFRGIGDPARA